MIVVFSWLHREELASQAEVLMALSVIKPSFPKLAQSVVRLTVERVVAGSIPRTGPKLRLR